MTLEQIVTDLSLSQQLKDAGMEQASLFSWYDRGHGYVPWVAAIDDLRYRACPCWTLAELLAHPKMNEGRPQQPSATNVTRPCASDKHRSERHFADTPTEAAGKLLLLLAGEQERSKRQAAQEASDREVNE